MCGKPSVETSYFYHLQRRPYEAARAAGVGDVSEVEVKERYIRMCV